MTLPPTCTAPLKTRGGRDAEGRGSAPEPRTAALRCGQGPANRFVPVGTASPTALYPSGLPVGCHQIKCICEGKSGHGILVTPGGDRECLHSLLPKSGRTRGRTCRNPRPPASRPRAKSLYRAIPVTMVPPSAAVLSPLAARLSTDIPTDASGGMVQIVKGTSFGPPNSSSTSCNQPQDNTAQHGHRTSLEWEGSCVPRARLPVSRYDTRCRGGGKLACAHGGSRMSISQPPPASGPP